MSSSRSSIESAKNDLEVDKEIDLSIKKTVSSHKSTKENFRPDAQNEKNGYFGHFTSNLKHKLNKHVKNSNSSSDSDLENQQTAVEHETDPEIIGYDPKSCEWDSPQDPDNPHNWPAWKRWYCTMTTAFLCLEITIGSSLYVDAVPEMMAKWKVSQTLCLGGLALYLLGLAFGPVIAAPMSELFGRKIVYCVSLPVSMVFIVGVALSTNIQQVLILRFLGGITSSGALAIAVGTITDVWTPQEIGFSMTLFCLAPLAGPVIGPVIGGFVAEKKYSSDPNVVGGLRWIMWVNLFFAAFVFVPLFLMPESYKPIIMKKRLIKRGKKIRKAMSMSQFLVSIVSSHIVKPVEMIFVEPIVLVFSIYAALLFAVLFGFFEAYPVIFRGIYGWKIGTSGLPFLGVGVGLIMGASVYLYIDKFIFFKKWNDGYIGMKDKEGNPIPPTPESRLLPCMVGSLTFAPSLFWLAWTSRTSVHWMAPIAAGSLFGFSLVLIFFSILTYFSMAYPPVAVASALAANNMFRYIISSAFPLFTTQMMEDLHVCWGVSIFGFVALLMIPVPWIFTKYGPTLRKRSKYGWSALATEKTEEKSGEEMVCTISCQSTATFASSTEV